MEFRLLGPLEVRSDDGQIIHIRGRNHPRILAALAVEAGQTIPIDRLVKGIWDGEPPDTASKQIQNIVGGLRRQLGDAQDLLETVGRGYRLAVPVEQVDWSRFRALWTESLIQRRDGLIEAALASIRAALAQWRGPALAGLSGPLTEGIATRLNDNRMSAIEDRLELELDVADRESLADEVRHLMAEHPLRQRFAGLLMRVLCREERSAEALRVFADLRDRLREELGVDPDPRLVQLHTEILRQGSSAAVAPPVPATAPPSTHLPHGVPEFTGRDQLLSDLDAELSGQATARAVVLSGTGGVGKTALALHWARRSSTAEAFPDGRLFVDLQGFTDNPPVGAADAVTILLRQLGVPGRRIPSDLDDARALCRQLLDERRCLVILDNAADVAQARPLLLSQRPSLTVVTSRNRLSGLAAADGAHRIGMDALTVEEARQLLRRLLGAKIVDESPEAASQLVELCARLPLALRVAAAGFADTHESTHLSDYVDLLRQDRLGTLDLDDVDTAVETVLSRSTNRLEPWLIDAFCRIGAHPGPRVDLAVLAALCDVSEVDARRIIRRLLAVHLAEETDTDRFGMHDLLREHALRLAPTHAVDVEAARNRLLAHYSTVLSDRDVDPDWVSAELPALLACLRLPGGESLLRYALALGQTLEDLGRNREGELAYSTALALAPSGSSEHFDALRGHGSVSYHSGHPDAEAHLKQALAGFRGLGDKRQTGRTLRGLGEQARWSGDIPAATVHNREALELFTECSDQLLRADALTAVAIDFSAVGDYVAARNSAAESVRIAEAFGDRRVESMARTSLAEVAQVTGDSDTATRQFQIAQRLYTALGDRAGVSSCALGLGRVAFDGGDLATAGPWFRLTLDIARERADTQSQAIALHELAKVAAGLGDHADRRELLTASRELCRGNGDMAGEAFTTSAIADSLTATGRFAEAAEQYRHAIDVFTEHPSYMLGPPAAYLGLGQACAGLERFDEAKEHWAHAMRILDDQDSSPRVEQLRAALKGLLDGLAAKREN